ncbi:hypothetical protein ONE63_011202 [Megalurothrips usitatus]|uniref:C2H2-type domain-containing protein n=1 Tax=Megalurothrips usitatus TaxID=439358 RepID=A0AAV7X3Q5_9NEOP|nr:hypothetical protein ONE63_011202 [Megalurothrips usitatus]
MYVFDKQSKIMHCKFCNCRVDWERKSSVDNHIKSTGHKVAKEKFKTNKIKRQASVGDCFDQARKAKQDRAEFTKSVAHAFVQANIPVHKLDHKAIRKLFNKYIPGGGDLPSARTLRDKYVPLLKKEFDEKLEAKLKGRKIAVLCNETTNRKGEAAFVTIFEVLPSAEETECFLMVASVKILSAANADTTSKAIIQVNFNFNKKYLRGYEN